MRLRSWPGAAAFIAAALGAFPAGAQAPGSNSCYGNDVPAGMVRYSDGAGGCVLVAANYDVTLLPSAARTTTQTSADLTNVNGLRLKVILDTTVIGTGSVTLSINGKDPASGKYYPILAGAAVVTNVTNVYTVSPSATAVTNVTANDFVPHIFQIVVTANNANLATYSVGYSLSTN